MKFISIIENNKKNINENLSKIKGIELFYSFGSIILMLFTCLPPFRSINSISASLKGYYYVNYFDLGFIKRGFVGTIFKLLNLPNYLSPSILTLSSHIFFLLCFGLIFWYFVYSSFQNWKIQQKFFFYTLFLLSPVLFIRLGYDIGRMDLICLNLSLLTLIFIQGSTFSYLFKGVILSFSTSIQLLIHEASLLLFIPLLFSIYIYKHSNLDNFKLKKLIPIFFVPLLIGFMLLKFGRYQMGADELNSYLLNISQELETSMNMELIYTLKQNFDQGFSLLTFKSILGGSYLITTYYFFILFILFKFVRMPIFIKLSVFSPLLLSFIAMDHTRFAAASTVCANLVFIFSAKESKLNCPRKFKFVTYIFILFIFFLGPWGIGSYDPLPLIKHY
tara:strand:- start:350 stop:1519 length:1170 start_codon:yes stop_codon:yes gene_type:complete